MTMYYTFVNTPVGKLLAAADETGLRRLAFTDLGEAICAEPGWVEDSSRFTELAQQLAAYFAGERRTFDLKLAPQGTAFQREVWEAVRSIPYGQRATYADLARKLGKPTAARAVGAANACNPLPILIPCHRVVGSNGDLTGYIGGLETKRKLLRLEQTGKLDEGEPAGSATA
jgi:methylated-DNA-[protein]-cysteine S-methyltransferase